MPGLTHPLLRLVAATLAATLLFVTPATGETVSDGPGLRAMHTSIASELARNALGEPIVIRSRESTRQAEGHAYAVLDLPFSEVAAVLGDRSQWCELLMLHLNNKYCRTTDEQGVPRVELYVGAKREQSVRSATRLRFAWLPPLVRADHAAARMVAPDGPYDTRDYSLVVEAAPIEASRTFLHVGYTFAYGSASHFAMHLYLGTIGRDKEGFTLEAASADDTGPRHVGGMRGVVERNVVRYVFAIRSHLATAQLPAARRLDARLESWFDATQRHPRQLHEVDREDYVRMKRNEFGRLASSP
jgi:hypothetical protein